MQVSGVSDFFGSVLNYVLLLLSYLWLLDRLRNQLVDDFVRGVYMYEKGCHALVKMTQDTQDAIQCKVTKKKT